MPRGSPDDPALPKGWCGSKGSRASHLRQRQAVKAISDCREAPRSVSQTTNPKRPGEVWNKPKASTYMRFGMAMFLNDEQHVQFAGLSEYSDGAECQTFKETYGEGVPEAGKSTMNQWVAAKVAYDAARADAKAEGNIPPLNVGLPEAHKAWLDEAIKDYEPKDE